MKIAFQVGVVALLSVAGCRCDDANGNTALLSLASPDSTNGLLTATLLANGPPVTRTLTLTNAGRCIATYTVAPQDTWLSVAPSTGTLAPGLAINIVVTISSRDASNALPVGSFSGALQVSASCPGQSLAFDPALIQVIVTIISPDAGVGDGGFTRTDAGMPASDAGTGGTPDAGTVTAGSGTCADPFLVSGLPLTARNTLSGPSLIASACVANGVSGPEHLYKLDFPTAGRVRANVTVLDGGLIPAVTMTEISCPAEFGSSARACALAAIPGEQARLWLNVARTGISYYLMIDGLENTSGEYQLDVAQDETPTTASGATCADAPVLTLVNGAAAIESHTADATDDGQLALNPGNTPTPCSSYMAKDRKYKVVVPGTAKTAVAIASHMLNEGDGSMVLGILNSCAGITAQGLAFPLACNRPNPHGGPFGGDARFTGVFDAGTELLLWVDGASNNVANTFPFDLNVHTAEMSSVANDVCGATNPLLALNASFSGTTLGATDEFGSLGANYAGPNCSPSVLHPSADVSYQYTATAAGNATFHLQPARGFDASMAILGACSADACLGLANGDGATGYPGSKQTVTVPLSAGQTVFVIIDTPESYANSFDRGAFTLSVTQD